MGIASSPVDPATAKHQICDEVDRRADLLLEVAHQIHSHPELGFEEEYAHELLTSVLAGEGIAVERSAFGLETAFKASAGKSGAVVAVLCEYDALPGIGHACGHNVIAAAGLGAGLAAAAMAGELSGRILVLGTPAEEGGGGKAVMAGRGAFDGVDAALMVHPAGADLDSMEAIAIQQARVEYHGAAAHAAAYPHRGRNALDAAVIGYTNVAALRQHIRPDERIHGIITHGGEQPNVVPEFAATHWYVRARTSRQLEPLKERVEACLRAGADAAGCGIELDWLEPAYAEMWSNEVLIDLYRANSALLGREVLDHKEIPGVMGSTDMGNVSQLLPSIHPMIKVAPPTVPIHSPEFARYAHSPEADRAVLDGAKALAMTIADIWLQPDLLAAMKSSFEELAATAHGPVSAS